MKMRSLMRRVVSKRKGADCSIRSNSIQSSRGSYRNKVSQTFF
jgi:hypothetical protein